LYSAAGGAFVVVRVAAAGAQTLDTQLPEKQWSLMAHVSFKALHALFTHPSHACCGKSLSLMHVAHTFLSAPLHRQIAGAAVAAGTAGQSSSKKSEPSTHTQSRNVRRSLCGPSVQHERRWGVEPFSSHFALH
jgi:hypothetical protein